MRSNPIMELSAPLSLIFILATNYALAYTPTEQTLFTEPSSKLTKEPQLTQVTPRNSRSQITHDQEPTGTIHTGMVPAGPTADGSFGEVGFPTGTLPDGALPGGVFPPGIFPGGDTIPNGLLPVDDLASAIFGLEDFCVKVLKLSSLENCTCTEFHDFPTCMGIGAEMKDEPAMITRLKYDPVLERTRAGITTAASLVGIVGNALIVAMSVRNRKNLSKCKALIGILALSDLLFAILQQIIVVPLFWTAEWVYGIPLCKTFISLNTLGSLFALGLILIIAVERYFGITRVVDQGLSNRTAYGLLLLNAILGLASIVPLILILDVPPDLPKCQEIFSMKASRAYSWYLLSFYFILPVFTMSYVYIAIFRHLQASYRSFKNMVGQNTKQLRKRHKENKRVVTILLSIFIAFIIFVLPNRLVWLILDYEEDLWSMSQATYDALTYFAIIPYSFHVMINPIIYTLVDPRMRKELIDMIRHPCRKERKASQQDQNRNRLQTQVSTTSINNIQLVNMPGTNAKNGSASAPAKQFKSQSSATSSAATERECFSFSSSVSSTGRQSNKSEESKETETSPLCSKENNVEYERGDSTNAADMADDVFSNSCTESLLKSKSEIVDHS